MRLFPVLAVLAFALRAEAQGVTPATYRVWLCTAPCSPTDSARAVLEAVVVVVDDATAATPAARDVMAKLSHLRERVPPAEPGNACFRVIRRQGSIAGEELFWGIVPSAATRIFRPKGGGFLLPMYTSPDASYELSWTESGPLARGEGWTAGPFVSSVHHRNGYFAALRVGPADLSACVPRS